VSGGQTVLVLSGEHARDVLANGCPLDLRPHAVGTGWCAQSHIAKAPVMIRLVDDVPTFEIVVRRSFADYLWTWLCDAADASPRVDRA
jgi:sarcosine oxidase subunit gamma